MRKKRQTIVSKKFLLTTCLVYLSETTWVALQFVLKCVLRFSHVQIVKWKIGHKTNQLKKKCWTRCTRSKRSRNERRRRRKICLMTIQEPRIRQLLNDIGHMIVKNVFDLSIHFRHRRFKKNSLHYFTPLAMTYLESVQISFAWIICEPIKFNKRNESKVRQRRFGNS